MTKLPTISIIVTTYQREQLLKETLISILNQTYTDFELIVVDNHSDYNFLESIDSIGDDRIKPFQNQNNGVIAVNRNYGIQRAKGQYIAFCDDDDLWHPDKLKLQVDAMQDSSLNVVGCELNLMSNKKSFNGYANVIRGMSKAFADEIILTEEYIKQEKDIALSSALVRREVAVRLNGFDEDKNLVGNEDYEFWLRILLDKDKSIRVLGQKLVDYRVHISGYSNTFNTNDMSYVNKMKLAFDKNNEALKKYDIESQLEQLKRKRGRGSVKRAYLGNEITLSEAVRNHNVGYITAIDWMLRKRIKSVLN